MTVAINPLDSSGELWTGNPGMDRALLVARAEAAIHDVGRRGQVAEPKDDTPVLVLVLAGLAPLFVALFIILIVSLVLAL